MIECKNCGAVLPNHAKYCKACGTQVPDNIKFCPNCHEDIPADAKYCSECGTHVNQRNVKSISAFLVILIFIGAGLVIYRSFDMPFKSNGTNNIITEDKDAYRQVSFQTMQFQGKNRNEVKIDVFSPTTQARMIQSTNHWLKENLESGKIRDKEETRIDLYEANSETNENILRAKLIFILLDKNPDYNFPDGDYVNIGENLYVMWLSKES